MTSSPLETRASYLRRVLPDLEQIGILVEKALHEDHYAVGDSTFYLDQAISKTQKLFGDLTRARLAE